MALCHNFPIQTYFKATVLAALVSIDFLLSLTSSNCKRPPSVEGRRSCSLERRLSRYIDCLSRLPLQHEEDTRQ